MEKININASQALVFDWETLWYLSIVSRFLEYARMQRQIYMRNI